MDYRTNTIIKRERNLQGRFKHQFCPGVQWNFSDKTTEGNRGEGRGINSFSQTHTVKPVLSRRSPRTHVFEARTTSWITTPRNYVKKCAVTISLCEDHVCWFLVFSYNLILSLATKLIDWFKFFNFRICCYSSLLRVDVRVLRLTFCFWKFAVYIFFLFVVLKVIRFFLDLKNEGKCFLFLI